MFDAGAVALWHLGRIAGIRDATRVNAAAAVISIFALLTSGAAVVYARLAAKAAGHQVAETRRQADAAHEELRLVYSPALTVTLKDEPAAGPDVLYEVRNDGRKDLQSVIVERPETSDHVRYGVARMGVSEDFDDHVELGPLRLGEASGLLLKVGSTTKPPEFRIRITCRAGEDTWVVSKLLEPRRTLPQAL